MEAIASEDIGKIAHQSHSSGNSNEDGEQPSGSGQPIVNQTAVENTRTTNTHRLEFPVLLLFFSWNLSGIVFQNQILYQTCILDYNQTTCEMLTNDVIPDEYKVMSITNYTKI